MEVYRFFTKIGPNGYKFQINNRGLETPINSRVIKYHGVNDIHVSNAKCYNTDDQISVYTLSSLHAGETEARPTEEHIHK